MNKEQFISKCAEHNLLIDSKTFDKFETFYNFLIQENSKYNLTAITNYEDVLEKHFYDSLSILFHDNLNGETLDIGCGGGFPGVPLKIVKNINLSCLDATSKKINYINLLSQQLNLDIKTYVGRAEEFNKQFDNVIARGVASLNVLLELVCNIVKLNGKVIAMKGSHYKEELDASKEAIEKLGYKLDSVYEYTLPNDNSIHANLTFIKIKKHDNKYPRNYSQIKSKPL